MEGLVPLRLSQAESAMALLWFHDHYGHGFAATADELNEIMRTAGLSPATESKALKFKLKNCSAIIIAADGKFSLTLTGRTELGKKYLSLLKKPNVLVLDLIIPDDLTKSLRPFYRDLARQINGTYKFAFYDGCLVLARRFVESLILDLFERLGHADKAKNERGEFLMLNGLVGIVNSGQYVRLSRSARAALECIKDVGDNAAHNRFHCAVERDVQNVEGDLRKLLSELIQAMPQPKSP